MSVNMIPPPRIAILFLLVGAAAFAQTPATLPTTNPAPKSNGWDPSPLTYEHCDHLVVEQTTPTPAQINFRLRPPQMPADSPDPVQTTSPPPPAVVDKIAFTHLRFRSSTGQIIPALLAKPADQPGPFPLVIAVHGMRSNKAQVCAQVAPALAKRGFAVLAADMPLHGERPGEIQSLWDSRNFLQTAAIFRQAVINVRECIDLARERDDLDTDRGVLLTGYSMGSWIGAIAGPADDRIRGMVLMVGGAVEYGRVVQMLPAVAVVDPLRAIVNFAPRPLLMLSAYNDDTVTPEMSKRLFNAAEQPKRQIWYRSGHLLPQKAYQDAADWMARTWRDLSTETNSR